MKNKTRSIVWKVLLAVVAISVVGIGTALVQEDKGSDDLQVPDARFVWSAPTTGTPVHHYVVQVLVNADTLFFDPVVSEEITFPVEYKNKYYVRVAAVDAGGTQGPMSDWSGLYFPELDPPAPPE